MGLKGFGCFEVHLLGICGFKLFGLLDFVGSYSRFGLGLWVCLLYFLGVVFPECAA